MEDLKQALAKRCIDKCKEPYRLDRCKDVRAWGKQVMLGDVKPGQIITIDGNFTSIEKLASDTLRPGPTTVKKEQTMLVTDVINRDGIVIIETPGALYSTIDFSAQWKQQYQTALINKSIEEAGQWIKNDTAALLDEFGITLKKSSPANLERIARALQKSAAEQGIGDINRDYTKEEIEKLQQAAKSEAQKIEHEIDYAEAIKWADKLYKMGKPVLYAGDIAMTNSKDVSVFYHYSHGYGGVADKTEHNKFPLIAKLEGVFDPMFAQPQWRGHIPIYDQLPNVTVREVIRPDASHYIIVTDQAILTNLEMHEQFRAVLEREGRQDLLAREDMRMSEYLAIAGHGHCLLSNPQLSDSTCWIAERCASNNIRAEHIDINMRDKVLLIDANGDKMPVEVRDLYPGAQILITANFTDMRTGEAKSEQRLLEVTEVVNAWPWHVTLNTNEGLLCTKDFSQELERAEVSLDMKVDTQGVEINEQNIGGNR